jgi:nucleotide-binding universal stress UspA family protein
MKTAEHTIRRIVVPLDGSMRAERALPVALALADQAGAAIELLTVQSIGGDWERRLQEIAESLPREDIDTTVVSSGAPDEAIADLAATSAGTVVCMATRGRTGLTSALLGSTAARVVRRSDTPVIILGPAAQEADPAPAFDRLVACLSGAPRAETMLPVVKHWAEQLGAQVQLVHGATDPDAASGTAARLRDLMANESRSGLPISVHIANGHTPAEGVARHLHHNGACLAFVTVRPGARMTRLLPGGFTAELLQRAQAPVVALTGPPPAQAPRRRSRPA